MNAVHEEKEMHAWVEREGLGDSVEFMGYFRDDDKTRVFSGSDIFVFPTYYGEGSPVSLLEAMASGMAVITSTVGGIPHIVVNGILMEKVTPYAVYNAIDSLLSSPDEMNALSERNRVEAWEKYEASVVTQFFEELYKTGCVANA